MTWKLTAIAIVVAVLGIVAVYLTRSDDAVSIRRSSLDAPQPLLARGELPVENVMRITIARRDQPRLVFERREEGRWQQIEPFPHPLERLAIRQLIVAATEVVVTDRLEADRLSTDLAPGALSLDPPDASITYEWDAPERGLLSLHLRRRTIAGRAYLKRPSDDAIYVVDQTLHGLAVELDPREWRDRTIFPGVGVESDRVIRTVGETRLVIERDRRQWRIIQPIQTRVDPLMREQFIQSLAAARAAGFIADQPQDLSRFGLDPPAASIEVITESTGQSHRLLIGSTAGAGTQDRFGIVDGRPTVIRIPARVLQLLFVHPADLADPTGSGVIPADVKTVRIIGPEGEFRIERDLEQWIAIDHDHRNVPREVMDEFLSTLTELRADQVELQQYPHELEVAIVTFFGFDDRPRDTVRILRDPDTNQWAFENGDNVLRVFTDAVSIRLTPQDFGLPAMSQPQEP